MHYYLKKDLGEIKAGAEIELRPGSLDMNNYRVFLKKIFSLSIIRISLDELPDWVEEREDGMWKPIENGVWYMPNLAGFPECKMNKWYGDSVDEDFFASGLVCQTEKMAVELREHLIKAAKSFWKEYDQTH